MYYPNIDTDAAITVIAGLADPGYWPERYPPSSPIPTLGPKVWKTCLESALLDLIVQYESLPYLQSKGIAMSITCSLDITNLFVSNANESLCHHPVVLFFQWYIDDLFMIVKAPTPDDALLIIQQHWQLHGCSVEWAPPGHTCVFLDMFVYLDKSKDLTALYLSRGYPENVVTKWLGLHLEPHWEQCFADRAAETNNLDTIVLKTHFNDTWNNFSISELCCHITLDQAVSEQDVWMRTLEGVIYGKAAFLDLQTLLCDNTKWVISRCHTKHLGNLTLQWHNSLLHAYQAVEPNDVDLASIIANTDFKVLYKREVEHTTIEHAEAIMVEAGVMAANIITGLTYNVSCLPPNTGPRVRFWLNHLNATWEDSSPP
ncbi:hypothetical protein V8B97DRAFT_2085463 [Scleroderma yunnanense]